MGHLFEFTAETTLIRVTKEDDETTMLKDSDEPSTVQESPLAVQARRQFRILVFTIAFSFALLFALAGVLASSSSATSESIGDFDETTYLLLSQTPTAKASIEQLALAATLGASIHLLGAEHGGTGPTKVNRNGFHDALGYGRQVTLNNSMRAVERTTVMQQLLRRIDVVAAEKLSLDDVLANLETINETAMHIFDEADAIVDYAFKNGAEDPNNWNATRGAEMIALLTQNSSFAVAVSSAQHWLDDRTSLADVFFAEQRDEEKKRANLVLSLAIVASVLTIVAVTVTVLGAKRSAATSSLELQGAVWTFDRVLEDKECLEVLLAHARSKLSEECVQYVYDTKAINLQSARPRMSDISSLIDLYVRENSEREVNISSRQRRAIVQEYDECKSKLRNDDEISGELLEALRVSEKEVTKLVMTNLYSTFLQSTGFLELEERRNAELAETLAAMEEHSPMYATVTADGTSVEMHQAL
ncbi:MAG: hypothetical protein MHM6MM_002414 [Cercozoa sp. M6MM]